MADKAVETTDNAAPNPPVIEGDVAGPVEEWSTDDDVDTIALREAQAALNGTDDDEGEAAEPEADQEAEQTETKPDDKPKAEAEPADAKADVAEPEAEMPTVPLARFQEVNGKFRESQETTATLQQQVAYLTGKLEAGKAPDQTQAEPEDPIAAERQKIVDLAQQFDDGDISYSELKKAEMEAEARIDGHLAARQPAPQPAAASDNMVLEMHADELASKHPFSGHLTDPQWDLIEAEARTALAEEIGRPLTGAGRDIMALQTRMGELTDKYGPAFTGKTLADISPQKPKATEQQPGPKGATAQQRQEKLDDAQRHPVDVNGLGSGATQGEMTEQEFVQLSDEDIMALPASVRDRFSNSS